MALSIISFNLAASLLNMNNTSLWILSIWTGSPFRAHGI
jgi:hypothetical protein